MEDNKKTHAELADNYKAQSIMLIVEHNISEAPSNVDPEAFRVLKRLAEQYKKENKLN